MWFGPTADSLEDRQTNSDGQVGVARLVEQPCWQSDGKQQHRIRTGMLARRVRPMHGYLGQQ